jgi:hypothetical protein
MHSASTHRAQRQHRYKIILEIEAADLVIADLTYARASVHCEAGYVQRAILVRVATDAAKERRSAFEPPTCR